MSARSRDRDRRCAAVCGERTRKRGEAQNDAQDEVQNERLFHFSLPLSE